MRTRLRSGPALLGLWLALPGVGLSQVPKPAFSSAPVFVSGVLLLPDGSPAVHVMLSAMDTAKGPTGVAGIARTDDNGAFVFNDPFNPGTYSILARGIDWSTSVGQVTTKADAGPVGLSLQLVTTSVSGTVTEATGQPAANASVTLMSKAAGLDAYYRTTTDAQGAFRLQHVAAGTYTLLAHSHANGPKPMGMASDNAFVVGTTDRTEQITLKPLPAGRGKAGAGNAAPNPPAVPAPPVPATQP